jgi:Cu2+-containing amine oxidase
MNIQPLGRFSFLAGVLVCAVTSLAAGQAVDLSKTPGVCSNSITQSFPTNGTAVTTWTICWTGGVNSRLAIGPVFFQKSPTSPQIEVLWDMRLSDIFIPYHPGQPRYYDLSDFNFGLALLTSADCPSSVGGKLLNSYVCEEVHDRGLMWKFDNTAQVRRGEELVLWAAIAAANYVYIDKYTFTDDGVIKGQLGATGQNLPGMEEIAHTHQGFWRIDIDLDGTVNNAARLEHIEDITDKNGIATDTRTPILLEEGFTWDPRKADMMEISNPVFKNAQGNLSTYHLMPLITGGGLIQNYETFTHNDFWVTLYTVGETEARKLPDYINPPDNIVNADIVAWIKGSLHHHPRDEDGVYNSNGIWTGVTHMMEAGFALMPNDLFDCTPFYHTTCP